MPHEIEIKIQVDAHDAVRQRLRERGAEPHGQILEINRIFDNAEHTLLATDRGLRIRECRGPRGHLARALLTYKGPKDPGPVKRREEIEVTIDDPAAAGALLEALGYAETVHFEKRRESWLLAGCEVELDEVPYLGCFVEIEGPDEPAIQRVRDEIGLGGSALVARSYIGLLVDYCARHQLPVTAIRF